MLAFTSWRRRESGWPPGARTQTSRIKSPAPCHSGPRPSVDLSLVGAGAGIRIQTSRVALSRAAVHTTPACFLPGRGANAQARHNLARPRDVRGPATSAIRVVKERPDRRCDTGPRPRTRRKYRPPKQNARRTCVDPGVGCQWQRRVSTHLHPDRRRPDRSHAPRARDPAHRSADTRRTATVD